MNSFDKIIREASVEELTKIQIRLRRNSRYTLFTVLGCVMLIPVVTVHAIIYGINMVAAVNTVIILSAVLAGMNLGRRLQLSAEMRKRGTK